MSKTVGLILSLQDKCSPQLNKIAERMGITEKEAKKVHVAVNKLNKQLTDGFKKASTALVVGVGAVAGATAVLVNKSVEAGDRIDKMSQKMQMSRQTFQELEYVFSQNGASIDIMQTGMSKLAKTMDSAKSGNKGSIQTFNALGISLKDTNGHLKSTEDVMFEAFSKLQKMPEGANKSALAMQLFGKSASELAPLLNGEAKSVDELRKKFNDLGMGMSDKQIDSAKKFKDTMDTIRRTFEGLGNQIGADLLPAVQSVADSLVNNMPKIKATVTPIIMGIANVTKFLLENFNAIIPVAVGVVGAIGAFQTISGVITVIQTLKSVIDTVRIAQGLWNVVMLANPIGLIATGVGLAIAGITALVMNWNKITEAVRKSTQAVKEFFRIKDNGKGENGNNAKSKYASGTSLSSGGTALVGENGPELVTLPLGSRVQTANETKNSLGKNITINLNIGGSVISEGELINKVSNVLGRQLQTALNC